MSPSHLYSLTSHPLPIANTPAGAVSRRIQKPPHHVGGEETRAGLHAATHRRAGGRER